jgi:hypothetical protein
MGPILAVSDVFQQPVAPTMAEGARKSDLSRHIPCPPRFIKNSIAVNGRLRRLRGSAVALKIRDQSGTVSEHPDWNLVHAVLGENGHLLCHAFCRDDGAGTGAGAAVRASADVCDRKNPGLLADR